MITTAEEVAQYVGGGRTPDQVEFAWQAAEAYVAARCEWEGPDAPQDLVEAVLLLSARYVARRNSPDGFVGMGEFGPARVPVSDRDVDRLIFPWRRTVLA